MVDINAKMVNELRQRTGVGLMDCKRALIAADGDMDAAIEALRVAGLAAATKKAGREASDGLTAAWVNDYGNTGVLIQVHCETDFVARTDEFRGLVNGLLAHYAGSPRIHTTGRWDACDELLGENFSLDATRTVRDILGDAVGKIGENIQLGRVAVINLEGRNALVQAYEHMGGTVTSLIGIEVGKAETLENAAFRALAKDLAMQAAAGIPQVAVALSRGDVPEAVLEGEKKVYREQILAEGKPENLVEKIMMGKLNKFYGEAVLLEQPFIKDDKQTVQKVIDGVAKEVGDMIKPLAFYRFAIKD
jgi:elongation factor Ts